MRHNKDARLFKNADSADTVFVDNRKIKTAYSFSASNISADAEEILDDGKKH